MRSRRDLRFCSAIWAFKRHGRLDLVRCTACSATIRRAAFQDELAASMRQPGSNWTPRPHPVAMQTSNISTFLVSLCRLADHAAAYSNPTSFSSPKTFHATR